MKILYVTTVGGTMGFFQDLIKQLTEKGDVVDIAANGSLSEVPAFYRALGCKIYPLSCTRSPFRSETLRAVGEIRRIVSENDYDIVHCHTPIAAMCTRLACRPLRRRGLKVFYTAHGFHFYKGAPAVNWLVYYPVEWVCSFWTDTLITINQEDYARAKKHLHARRVEYVPGVGIDTEKFAPAALPAEERRELRRSLGLADGEKMLLSVGELSARKNHRAVIQALASLRDPAIKYYICGEGALRQELEDMIRELGLDGAVHLLGYREDISALVCCADLFVLPSRQEGLPVALMEAIAAKTPVICSAIRGNTELADGGALFPWDDVPAIAQKIRTYLDGENKAETERNYERLKKYDLSAVIRDVSALYTGG